MIWNQEFETLPREALESLQLKRLQATVNRVYATVPFYKKKFDEIGLKPVHIKTLKDMRLLPFTVKTDLRDNYPFGLFSVPMSSVVRVHASSGTTGKPIVVGYTRRDIDTWAELMARTLTAAGIHQGDIVHNAYGYGLFTGGLGAHYGAERIGASVVPISGGNTKRQILILKDFGPTAITCTPSYALHLADVAREMGIDPARDFKLRVGCFGAEAWSENMRAQIEKTFNIDAIDIFGLTEVIGPGVSSECLEAKNGLHVFEDHFIPEIIDPASGEPLPWGEKGELVFTSITKEAFPVIRYRTRDLTRLNAEQCVCGRTFVRMERITGRTDDMLIIRGVNVFPSQIESALLQIEGLEPHYQIIVDRKNNLDTIELQVEVNEKIFSDEVKKLEVIEKRVVHDIKEMFGVSCTCKLVEPKTIARSEGKAQRVIDKRKI
ncbi:MAG: phenylacetate--CoA ligase [Deltaproteobacteria bacterium]|nr:phenylacetate--CoA ligase [Deltaproteobacteria bacterium]